MGMKWSPKVIIVTIMFVLGVLVAVCLYIPRGHATVYYSPGDHVEEGYFEINPDTILNVLSSGNQGVFTPTSSTPEVYGFSQNKLPTGTYPWSQTDYMKISGAVFETVWNESSGDWNLFSMFFKKNCKDSLDGFYQGSIAYSKAMDESAGSYIVRDISILPLTRDIIWGQTGLYQGARGWKSIDKNHLVMGANDALQIAEANGGNKFRSDVKNQCEIYLRLGFWGNFEGWHISYSANLDNYYSFEVVIDPYSGEYNVVDVDS